MVTAGGEAWGGGYSDITFPLLIIRCYMRTSPKKFKTDQQPEPATPLLGIHPKPSLSHVYCPIVHMSKEMDIDSISIHTGMEVGCIHTMEFFNKIKS